MQNVKIFLTTLLLKLAVITVALQEFTGPNGLAGTQNEPCLNVIQGEQYVINVSQFSTSTNGYNIDFSASTAAIYDTIPPRFDSLAFGCDGKSLTLFLTENVFCSAFTNSGSNFSINYSSDSTNTLVTIDSISGENCSLGGEYENTFTFYLSETLTANSFYLEYIADLNDLTDMCNNAVEQEDVQLSFDYAPYSMNITDSMYCFPPGETETAYIFQFEGGAEPFNYFLNGNSIASNSIPDLSIPGTYELMVVDQNNCSIVSPPVTFLGDGFYSAHK